MRFKQNLARCSNMSIRASTLFDFAWLLLPGVAVDGSIHHDIADGGVGHAVAVRGTDLDRLDVRQDAHHVFAGSWCSIVDTSPSRFPQGNDVSLIG